MDLWGCPTVWLPNGSMTWRVTATPQSHIQVSTWSCQIPLAWGWKITVWKLPMSLKHRALTARNALNGQKEIQAALSFRLVHGWCYHQSALFQEVIFRASWGFDYTAQSRTCSVDHKYTLLLVYSMKLIHFLANEKPFLTSKQPETKLADVDDLDFVWTNGWDNYQGPNATRLASIRLRAKVTTHLK